MPQCVLHLGIELDEVLLAREHLAARVPYPRLRDVAALHFLLPFGAVTGQPAANCGYSVCPPVAFMT